MADEQNKAVPTPAPAPDWMNQPTEGATPAPAQATIGPDFSSIPGYHPVQQDSSEQAQVRFEGGLPQRSTHRDTKAEMGVAPASLSTEPIENYTQEGRAEHPIVAQLGDITKSLKELLAGGQYAGKPMGTESGLLNNPVTQAMSATDAPEIAAAGEELLKTGASKAANAILEHPWATATHPEGSTEAGFASIPGHREIAPPAEVSHTGHAGSINEVKLKQGENDIAALHFTHDGDTASVNDTWVDEAHRGEGHGQHLLREAAAKAKANGAKIFTSDADGATSPDAQHAWDALVRKGEAEETTASKEGFTRVPKYQIKLSEAGAEEKGVPEVGKHLGLSEDKTREIYGVDNPPKPGQDVEGMSGKSANADTEGESANADTEAPGKYHPDLQAVVDKYGESDDPYKVSHGASFVTPEGKFVHGGGGTTHGQMIGSDDKGSFLNDTNAIRLRASFDRQGHTLHISVPDAGANAEQVDALKAAARQALGSGKSGNIVMEDASGTKSKIEEFANANNIEPMLKHLGLHPDPQAGMSWSERAEDISNKQQGAFTVNPRTGAVPGSGHILEAVPEVRQISDTPNTAKEMEKYSNQPEVKKLLKKYPELYVGGYKNSAGKYELNLSAVTKDAASAEKVAKATDQESYWDANDNKLVQTGGKNLQTEFKDYSVAQRLRDLAPQEPGDTISSRVPSAVAATEDALRHNLTVGDKAILDRSPALADKWANAVRDYPGLRVPEGADSKTIINAFQDHVKDNLKWLYNQSTPEEQAANQGWYDGAHTLTKDLAAQHGYSHSQTAGVIAAMSPQKDWDMNVSLAKRLTDIYKNQQEFKATPEMIAKGKDIVKATQAVTPTANAAIERAIKKISGKSLSQLTDPIQRSTWLRLYDETYNAREFPKINPDGTEGELRTNAADGASSSVAWGGANEITKAMDILKDGSRENISNTLSMNHKTRSFYNNIIEPNSAKGDVTIDTHAVAAGLMRPLSGDNPEVITNFGSPRSSTEGLRGTYPLYHSAYTQAAKELDIAHPRQLQSVVREKIRNLFPSEFKTPEAKAAIDGIWKESQNGQITADEARAKILDYAKSNAGVHEAEQPADGQSQLFGGSVHGEPAEGNRPRSGGGNAVGDKANGQARGSRESGDEVAEDEKPPIKSARTTRKASKGIGLSFLTGGKSNFLK